MGASEVPGACERLGGATAEQAACVRLRMLALSAASTSAPPEEGKVATRGDEISAESPARQARAVPNSSIRNKHRSMAR